MRRFIGGAAAFLILVMAPAAVAAQAAGDGTVVIAVRHAERADQGPGADPMISSSDPPLSEIGLQRAACLARTLEHVGVTRVLSTPYARTQQTAAPVAEMAGVEVEEYNPRALGDFAEGLRGAGGVIVVVGHSNTTPGVVEALGGDPVSPIDELEYERLYTVFMVGESTRSTLTAFCPAG